ncbi:MAG: hypothetical protein ABI629_14875 [bacterium]
MSFDFDDDDEWRAPELTSEDVPEDGFLLNATDEPAATEPAPPAASSRRAASSAAEQTALHFERDDTDEAEPEAADERPSLERSDDLRRPDDDEDDDAASQSALARPRPAAAARRPRVKAPPAEPRQGGIGVRAVFVFLFVVIGAYGALTWSLLDDPNWARRLTQRLPVVGPALRERSAGEEVALIDVEGRYERTKDGKAVFVITGKAVNHSADSLRRLEIVAALYDGSERRLDQQITACGNPLEAKIRELSVHQVSILRSIKPPASFGVQPGGQCPFSSIFVDVPTAAAAFSTQVARAQRNT